MMQPLESLAHQGDHFDEHLVLSLHGEHYLRELAAIWNVPWSPSGDLAGPQQWRHASEQLSARLQGSW